jgi:hypothetical protein
MGTGWKTVEAAYRVPFWAGIFPNSIPFQASGILAYGPVVKVDTDR